jgi:hypothetical protein
MIHLNVWLICQRLPQSQSQFGDWKGYWTRLGLYKVIFIFEVDEHNNTVWIDGIKHKRQDVYWKSIRGTKYEWDDDE